MCDNAVSEDPFVLVCCPNKYKTQRLYDEAADDCLVGLKCTPERFVRSKMLEKFDNALRANDDILFYNEYFDHVAFIANQRYIFSEDLDNDYNFDEDKQRINVINQLIF